MNILSKKHPSSFLNNSNNTIQTNLQTPDFTMFLNNFPNYYDHYQSQSLHYFPSNYYNSTSLSNTSTSDEAVLDDHVQLINERKHRRMISNRESARRSRMRKKSRFDELCKLVAHLRSENYDLLEKVNHISESYDNILQENMQLKEETCELRQWLTEHVRIESPHNIGFKDASEQLEMSKSGDDRVAGGES